MKNQIKGFTLIELIMVIVVLGILAAFAIPRFVDFGSNARVAKAQGALGAIKAAAAVAHAQCMLTATCANITTANNLVMEGQTVAMIDNYPTTGTVNVAGTGSGGIMTAAQIDATVTTGDYAAAVGNGVLTLTVPGATNTAACIVTYTQATATTAPATFGITTTGC